MDLSQLLGILASQDAQGAPPFTPGFNPHITRKTMDYRYGIDGPWPGYRGSLSDALGEIQYGQQNPFSFRTRTPLDVSAPGEPNPWAIINNAREEDPYTKAGDLYRQSGEAKKRASTRTAKKQGPLPRPGNLLIALGADILLNRGRGDLLGGYVSGHAKGREWSNSDADRQAQQQAEQDLADAANYEKEADYLLQREKIRREQANADRDYNLREKTAVSKEDARNDAAINRIWVRYDSATNPQEVRDHGKRLQVLDSANAPTDAEIEARVGAIQADRQKLGIAQWVQLKSTKKLNDLGEFTQRDVDDLEPARKQLERQYGIALPPLRTGKSALTKYRDERAKQWKINREDKLAQFKIVQDGKDKDRIQRQASLDLATDRFEYAKQQGNYKMAEHIGKMAMAEARVFNADLDGRIKVLVEEKKRLTDVWKNANNNATLTPAQSDEITKKTTELARQIEFLQKQKVNPTRFKLQSQADLDAAQAVDTARLAAPFGGAFIPPPAGLKGNIPFMPLPNPAAGGQLPPGVKVRRIR